MVTWKRNATDLGLISSRQELEIPLERTRGQDGFKSLRVEVEVEDNVVPDGSVEEPGLLRDEGNACEGGSEEEKGSVEVRRKSEAKKTQDSPLERGRL